MKCDIKNYAAFYTQILPALRETAHRHGYALGLHGSMARDLDIIAVPWVEGASATEDLIRDLAQTCGGYLPPGHPNDGKPTYRNPEEKPHGRRSWNICWGGRAFIDIAVFGPERANTRPSSIHAENESKPADSFQSAPDDAATLKCEGCGATFSEAGRPYRSMVGCRCDTPLVPIKQSAPDDAATIAELRRKLAERDKIIKRWSDAGMKHYPPNWACDFGNPEMVIGNIVRWWQDQLAARPAPGGVPELTDEEIDLAWTGTYGFRPASGYKGIRACIRAAFAKMPGRKAFDVEAWIDRYCRCRLQPRHNVAQAVMTFAKAAGIPVKE